MEKHGLYFDNYNICELGLKFVALYERRIGNIRPLLKHLGLNPTQAQLKRPSISDVDKLPWFNPLAPQTLQESLCKLKEWKHWQKLAHFDENKLTVNWEVISQRKILNPNIALPEFIDLDVMPKVESKYSFSDLTQTDLWPQGALTQSDLARYKNKKTQHSPISGSLWNLGFETSNTESNKSKSRSESTNITDLTNSDDDNMNNSNNNNSNNKNAINNEDFQMEHETLDTMDAGDTNILVGNESNVSWWKTMCQDTCDDAMFLCFDKNNDLIKILNITYGNVDSNLTKLRLELKKENVFFGKHDEETAMGNHKCQSMKRWFKCLSKFTLTEDDGKYCRLFYEHYENKELSLAQKNFKKMLSKEVKGNLDMLWWSIDMYKHKYDEKCMKTVLPTLKFLDQIKFCVASTGNTFDRHECKGQPRVVHFEDLRLGDNYEVTDHNHPEWSFKERVRVIDIDEKQDSFTVSRPGYFKDGSWRLNAMQLTGWTWILTNYKIHGNRKFCRKFKMKDIMYFPTLTKYGALNTFNFVVNSNNEELQLTPNDWHDVISVYKGKSTNFLPNIVFANYEGHSLLRQQVRIGEEVICVATGETATVYDYDISSKKCKIQYPDVGTTAFFDTFHLDYKAKALGYVFAKTMRSTALDPIVGFWDYTFSVLSKMKNFKQIELFWKQMLSKDDTILTSVDEVMKVVLEESEKYPRILSSAEKTKYEYLKNIKIDKNKKEENTNSEKKDNNNNSNNSNMISQNDNTSDKKSNNNNDNNNGNNSPKVSILAKYVRAFCVFNKRRQWIKLDVLKQFKYGEMWKIYTLQDWSRFWHSKHNYNLQQLNELHRVYDSESSQGQLLRFVTHWFNNSCYFEYMIILGLETEEKHLKQSLKKHAEARTKFVENEIRSEAKRKMWLYRQEQYVSRIWRCVYNEKIMRMFNKASKNSINTESENSAPNLAMLAFGVNSGKLSSFVSNLSENLNLIFGYTNDFDVLKNSRNLFHRMQYETFYWHFTTLSYVSKRVFNFMVEIVDWYNKHKEEIEFVLDIKKRYIKDSDIDLVSAMLMYAAQCIYIRETIKDHKGIIDIRQWMYLWEHKQGVSMATHNHVLKKFWIGEKCMIKLIANDFKENLPIVNVSNVHISDAPGIQLPELQQNTNGSVQIKKEHITQCQQNDIEMISNPTDVIQKRLLNCKLFNSLISDNRVTQKIFSDFNTMDWSEYAKTVEKHFQDFCTNADKYQKCGLMYKKDDTWTNDLYNQFENIFNKPTPTPTIDNTTIVETRKTWILLAVIITYHEWYNGCYRQFANLDEPSNLFVYRKKQWKTQYSSVEIYEMIKKETETNASGAECWIKMKNEIIKQREHFKVEEYNKFAPQAKQNVASNLFAQLFAANKKSPSGSGGLSTTGNGISNDSDNKTDTNANKSQTNPTQTQTNPIQPQTNPIQTQTKANTNNISPKIEHQSQANTSVVQSPLPTNATESPTNANTIVSPSQSPSNSTESPANATESPANANNISSSSVAGTSTDNDINMSGPATGVAESGSGTGNSVEVSNDNNNKSKNVAQVEKELMLNAQVHSQLQKPSDQVQAILNDNEAESKANQQEAMGIYDGASQKYLIVQNGDEVHLYQPFICNKKFTVFDKEKTRDDALCTTDGTHDISIAKSWYYTNTIMPLMLIDNTNYLVPIAKDQKLILDCNHIVGGEESTKMHIHFYESNDSLMSDFKKWNTSEWQGEECLAKDIVILSPGNLVCVKVEFINGNGTFDIPILWLKPSDDYVLPPINSFLTVNTSNYQQPPPLPGMPHITESKFNYTLDLYARKAVETNPNIIPGNDGANGDDFELPQMFIRISLDTTEKQELKFNQRVYQIQKCGYSTRCKIIYWESEDEIIVDTLDKGRQTVHKQSLIGTNLQKPCCTIYHPEWDAFLPVFKNQVVLNSTFDAYRVQNAQYNWLQKQWELICVDEKIENATVKFINTDVYPCKNQTWHDINGEFFVLNDIIGQYDGVFDEISGLKNPSNTGDKLRLLLNYFEMNEDEIKEHIEEINNNGINTSDMKNHKRFSAQGFAFQASNC